MIAIFNSLPVEEGAADRIVERFAEGRGHAQGFPGFAFMEVLKSEGEDEVLVVTRWQDRDSSDAWVGARSYVREPHLRCRR
jgi:heme-degrading monooxygenase HmoA